MLSTDDQTYNETLLKHDKDDQETAVAIAIIYFKSKICLWVCRVVQAIGSAHQPDMCHSSCSAEHQWFYVRACPDRSQTIKPGMKRKRRLDLKMDLSSSNCHHSFHELLMLGTAQLEVQELAVGDTHMNLDNNPHASHLAGITCWQDMGA